MMKWLDLDVQFDDFKLCIVGLDWVCFWALKDSISRVAVYLLFEDFPS